MTRKKSIAFTALTSALLAAAPAVAQAPALTVSGGELGCTVRLMVFANAARTAAEDAKKSQADRDSMKAEADKANLDFEFYAGRISRDAESDARRKQTLDIFTTFMDLPSDQMAKEVGTCQEWAQGVRTSTLESLKSK